MSILIKNIKQLLQVREALPHILLGGAMDELPILEDAFLLIEDDIIKDYGSMSNCPANADEVINAIGRVVMPSFIDSHTHLVFAAPRDEEFVDRINGLTYEEIAKKGGGILNSADKLAKLSEDQLFTEALARLNELVSQGTGAIEIKSGYGLSKEAELKMLRVVKRLKEASPVKIKATFLGAHAIPPAYKGKQSEYVDLVIDEILPEVVEQGLAEYIDVFCEDGYFTAAETERIMEAGNRAGLRPKIHVNQFNSIGGIEVCVNNNALSVDHLEVMDPKDYDLLETSNTIATLLPSCSFFLQIPYGPAKELMKRNIPIALASDFNPGSTPSGNMQFVIALACIQMKMTPEQAINAATVNAAYAMEIEEEYGCITKGMKANVIITKPIPSYNFIPYSFASNHIEESIINGKRMK